jgi:ribosomal-protein-alanine N-acetyltransferase
MILETQRLFLREALASDAEALASYQSNSRYLEHYAESPDAKAIVKQASAWATTHPRENFQLIVTLKGSHEIIGCVGLRQKGCAGGTAEIGIELSPDYWGSGYAKEAIAELVKFGTVDLNLDRFVSVTSATNVRAHNLLGHFGFNQTGVEGSQFVYEASTNAV